MTIVNERFRVFQEWLLSRRIICYTELGVLLQCRSDGEVLFGDEFPGRVENRSDAELAIKSSLRVNLRSGGAESIHSSWEEVVTQYSKRKLTQPAKDRVIALSVTTKEFEFAWQRALGFALNPASGLFPDRMRSGLLWEQAERGPHRRLGNFPTWSWTSIDSGVVWGHHAPNKDAHRLVASRISIRKDMCAFVDIIPVHRAQLGELHNVLGHGATSSTAAAAATVATTLTSTAAAAAAAAKGKAPITSIGVDEDNFAVLRLRARLIPILVKGYFASKERLYVATDTSGHPAREYAYRHDMQRTVAVPSAADILAGWASLEHPDFQDDAVFGSTGPSIYALVVSELRISGDASWGLGYFSGTYKAYNILCVVETDRLAGGFERAGRGAIFGKEAERAVELATTRDVWLV